ncbi:sensor domain-containing diguanylate cyclase [Bittarella massiliensis (ex Durand et al. 2017)]|uniref:sensor domain-containing diguanylate cyclase n=1 Tax=Bittarella massiliensis (ex Durand et al. 2017) TaxID=1720313 RepID=UPI001AA0CCAD|nr:diguanylate cyclase [Bittarella massiliensis (ex Durand et al. 2017)]
MKQRVGHRRKNLLLPTCAIALALVLSVLSFVSYQRGLRATLLQKTEEEMARYTHQSGVMVSSLVEDYFAQLDAVALFCAGDAGRDIDNITELLRRQNGRDENCKLGLAGLDGALYTGTSVPVDISGRDFFQRAAAGERVLSRVHGSCLDGRSCVVLAIPVYEGEQVAGVAYAEYAVNHFTEMLGSAQFAGLGATMVIQPDGAMVSGYAGTERYETFYDAISQMDFRGEDTLASLRERVEAGESGLFTYYRNGKARYLYFEPAGVGDWTVLSLVIAESVEQQFSSINGRSAALMGLNLLLYSVVLLCIWLIWRKNQAAVRANWRDSLTGIYNRGGVRAVVEPMLMRVPEGGRVHACLFIDVDDFKGVNDRLGHQVGDQALIQLAGLLQRTFRQSDVVGRYGGDEFLVWMRDAPSAQLVEHRAKQLCESVAACGDFPTSISVGVALWPQDGSGYDELLRAADQALYAAKGAGKNRVAFSQNAGQSG